MVLSLEGKQMDLSQRHWHITIVTVTWYNYVPLGLHLSVASVFGIYEDILYVRLHLDLWEGAPVSGRKNSSWYNHQNSMTTRTHGFATSMTHFCIGAALSSRDTQSQFCETSRCEEQTSLPALKGEHLKMALFSLLLQSVADMNTVENVWPVETEVLFLMWDVHLQRIETYFLIFNTTKGET